MKATLSLVARKELVELDRLAMMRPAELRRIYEQIFGRPVAAGSSGLARRKLAWHFHAEREGGLPESARQHALAIAQGAGVRGRISHGNHTGLVPHATVTRIISDHDSRVPMPGSVIVKEHRGQTIMVRVLDVGFEYKGQRFLSLTAIAKEITGTKWNGFLFFGLTKGNRRGR